MEFFYDTMKLQSKNDIYNLKSLYDGHIGMKSFYIFFSNNSVILLTKTCR